MSVPNEPRVITPQEAQDSRSCDCWERHYTPQEAQLLIDRGGPPANPMFDVLALHTIAAEPDRIRAAVVKALHRRALMLTSVGEHSAADILHEDADAIENGADW